MDVKKLLIEATNHEIEAVALAYFAQMCDMRGKSTILKLEAREEYKKLAGKVRSIMDLRGDKQDG